MKVFVSAFFAALLTAAGAVAIGAVSSSPVVRTPGNMHWIAGTGPGKGSSTAVLTGDPSKAGGTAVIRVKMPDGYVNQPHYHSQPEYITVIQGTLLFGTGDKVDKSKATSLPAGSFIMVPAGVHHWSVVQGETTEQVSGPGPLTNLPIKH